LQGYESGSGEGHNTWITSDHLQELRELQTDKQLRQESRTNDIKYSFLI